MSINIIDMTTLTEPRFHCMDHAVLFGRTVRIVGRFRLSSTARDSATRRDLRPAAATRWEYDVHVLNLTVNGYTDSGVYLYDIPENLLCDPDTSLEDVR